MKPEDVDYARRILGLGVRATLKQVKDAYKESVKEHHPDRSGDAGEFAKVKGAYDTIMEYTKDYSYSFSADEVRRQYPQEAWSMMCQNDPIWGRRSEK
jgi:DnaJ-class molecular chaperone